MKQCHPLKQALHVKRLRAISEALEYLAQQIHAAAYDPEFLEETEGSWSDSFFRAVRNDPVGLVIESHFQFYPADARRNGYERDALNDGLMCNTTIGSEHFKGCEPIPLEMELIHDILWTKG